MTGPHPNGKNTDAGFSLVAVLVFMLIVSAVVAPFALTAKTRLMIANNEVEQERLSLLAEGLANVISSELADGSGAEMLSLNSTPTACRSGAFTFDVRVQDHSGLIDLNAADDQLLSLGFASLGFERQTSEALAKAAIQFRDAAKAFAGQAEPRAAVGPLEDKLAAFESVSELQEFSALAAIPLHELHAVFTVNSKLGTISLDRVPNRLRVFLAGAGGSASVVQAAADASAYTVNVAVRRDGSGIAGDAGFIIEKFLASASGFWRLSRSPVAPAGAGRPSSISCDALFGAETARILAGWSS